MTGPTWLPVPEETLVTGDGVTTKIGVGVGALAVGGRRRIGRNGLEGIVGAQHLLEDIELLRDLRDRLVALLGDHLKGGGRRQRKGRAIARYGSNQVASRVENLNRMDGT